MSDREFVVEMKLKVWVPAGSRDEARAAAIDELEKMEFESELQSIKCEPGSAVSS